MSHTTDLNPDEINFQFFPLEAYRELLNLNPALPISVDVDHQKVNLHAPGPPVCVLRYNIPGDHTQNIKQLRHLRAQIMEMVHLCGYSVTVNLSVGTESPVRVCGVQVGRNNAARHAWQAFVASTENGLSAQLLEAYALQNALRMALMQERNP